MTNSWAPAGPTWPVVRLDELTSRGSGHTPSKRRPEYWAGPNRIKWVSLADTARLDNGAILDTEHAISELGLAHSAAVLRPAGTVILLRGSSVGKSAVMGSDMAVSQDYVTWTCGPRLEPWFLYFFLQSRKAEFARVGFGNTIKTIGLDYFEHLVIPLPEISEQRRISESLRNVDILIATLERKIAKKRAMRQGILQEVVTGRTRLPGFSDAWAWRPFPEVMSRLNAKKHQILASGYSTIGRIPVVDQGQKPIIGYTDKVEAAFDPGDDGAIVFGDHTCITKYVDFVFAVGADGTQLLKAKGLNSTRFMAYALDVDPVLSTGYNRHFKLLREKSFPVPSLPEQDAICAVILDLDRQIEELGKRIGKARAIKSGMMQQLLTGRTRLLVEVAS